LWREKTVKIRKIEPNKETNFFSCFQFIACTNQTLVFQ
jgi:hypothetical protein